MDIFKTMRIVAGMKSRAIELHNRMLEIEEEHNKLFEEGKKYLKENNLMKFYETTMRIKSLVDEAEKYYAELTEINKAAQFFKQASQI